MEEALILIYIKIVFVLACFGYASYTDIKTRRVPNRLWLAMLPPGLVFIYLEQLNYIWVFGVFLLCSIFGYTYFQLGWWGGADMKAIAILALYFPYVLHPFPLVIWILLISSIISALVDWKAIIHLNLKSKSAYMPSLTASICVISIYMLSVPILVA